MPRSLPPSLWWNSFWPHAVTSITLRLCACFSSFFFFFFSHLSSDTSLPVESSGSGEQGPLRVKGVIRLISTSQSSSVNVQRCLLRVATAGPRHFRWQFHTEVFVYARSMSLLGRGMWMEWSFFLFMCSVPLVVVPCEERRARRPLAHTRSTKAAASQIALLIQSWRTLFIHYLFPGSAIVAGHCEER